MDLEFMPDAFNVDEVLVWLKQRFTTTSTRAEGNKTRRVDKHSAAWNALLKKLPYRTFSELALNMETILMENYGTPSSRQSALSMLLIVFGDYAGAEKQLLRDNFSELNSKLKKDYLLSTAGNKSEGMSFAEAKTISSDNPTVSLYFKLVCGEMAVLRLGDWCNASTIDDGITNYINVKERTMLRRITKNQKGVMTIKIPKIIIDEIKKQKIQGALFGTKNEGTITALLKKTMPDMVITSRHFRTMFATEKVMKMKSVEKIRETLAIMDHNLKTFVTIYQRGGTAFQKILKELN